MLGRFPQAGPCVMCTMRHGAQRLIVTPECLMALRYWQVPTFLTKGLPMGTVLSRKVVTTNTGLTGCGGIHKGRNVRGCWRTLPRVNVSVSLFETLSPVSFGLSCLCQDGQHDNSGIYKLPKRFTVCSRMLNSLACELILWSTVFLLSLSDLRPRLPEHGIRPVVLGCADLRGVGAQCALFISLRGLDAPLGIDALGAVFHPHSDRRLWAWPVSGSI